MAKSKLVKANEKIIEGVTSGYRKIEDAIFGKSLEIFAYLW